MALNGTKDDLKWPGTKTISPLVRGAVQKVQNNLYLNGGQLQDFFANFLSVAKFLPTHSVGSILARV